MTGKLRWGILGTGRIAGEFAEGLKALQDAELVAVGSRTQATADAFADRFKISRRHPTYEALATDPSVDAIYISTPHNLHKENSILCLRQGKAVLCEKPFTVNAREAAELIAVARQEKRFLMEAMWTRCLPAIEQVRAWLAEGVIGEPRMFQASFGFRAPFDPKARLFDLAFGGGALLDVGIYPIAFAFMVFGGPPKDITALAHLGESGADEQSAFLFKYGKGELAVMSSAIRTETNHDAYIHGTAGTIHVHAPFWRAQRVTLSRPDQEDDTRELPYPGNGYTCEAAHVAQCLREEKLESPLVPLDESLQMMKAMDEIRNQWGLRYPAD
jgi:predicted dehydrogenase